MSTKTTNYETQRLSRKTIKSPNPEIEVYHWMLTLFLGAILILSVYGYRFMYKNQEKTVIRVVSGIFLLVFFVLNKNVNICDMIKDYEILTYQFCLFGVIACAVGIFQRYKL